MENWPGYTAAEAQRWHGPSLQDRACVVCGRPYVQVGDSLLHAGDPRLALLGKE